MIYNAMVNSTSNITTEGATEIRYEVIFDGVLLLIAIFVIVLDLLVIAALIADSDIVCSIRWILVNILVAGVVGALGSVLYHIMQVVTVFAAASFEIEGVLYCQAYLVIMGIGNAGRILMATFYAVTVFIVVRCWNRPVLAPRNTKYFIIGAVLVWIVLIPLVVTIIIEAVAVLFCSSAPNEMEKINVIIGTAVFFLLSIFPILFTFLFLIITVCYVKRHTIRKNSAAEKAMLKFGFFLIVGQGVNAVGQIICPALFLVLSSHRDRSVIITILGAIIDLSLIATPILVTIVFKPVWYQLRKWFCSCSSKCSFGTTHASQDTAQRHTIND